MAIHNPQQFWAELLRRRVVRAAVYYVAGAWSWRRRSTWCSMRSMPRITCASSSPASCSACRWRRCLPGCSISRPSGIERTPSLPVPAVDPPEDSIAVLPFANLSNEAENEYSRTAWRRRSATSLRAYAGLRVAARSSSFAFKGRHEDVREIGRRLNVASVLEGGVRRQAGTVRIDVQLVSAADGYQVWSETFERRLDDIFKLQTEVAVPSSPR